MSRYIQALKTFGRVYCKQEETSKWRQYEHLHQVQALVRKIMSRLGRLIQVLAALNPVDPLHNFVFGF